MSKKNQIYYFATRKQEFLSRELGWKYYPRILLLNFQNILENRDSNCVVLIGNTKNEESFLDELKINIWVMLYADETYLPSKTYRILKKRNVVGIIRPYPLYESSKSVFVSHWNQCLLILKHWKYEYLKNNKSLAFKVLLITLIFNFRIVCVTLVHKLFRKPHLRMLLGYTNEFSKVVAKKFQIGESKSLLKITPKSFNKKNLKICYIGQEGKSWRKLAINALENARINNTFIATRRKFLGNEIDVEFTKKNQLEYVQTIYNSKFTLCPPGNYSAQTYRWIESLVLGSLPIYLPFTFPDCFNSNYFQKNKTSIPLTWRDLIKENLKYDSKSTSENLFKYKQVVLKCIQTLNFRISNLEV